MNVSQIKYFVELCRMRSFSKAAENMAVSQPALSLQIQKLEEEFGYLLVDRNTKPISITTEGTLFLEKAQQIIQLMNDLDQLSVELEDEVAGQIRIGIIPTLSPYLVPLVMELASSKYPDLKVEVVEMVTETILSELNYNTIDAGIISTPIRSSGQYAFAPLFYERFYLYVAENNPLYQYSYIQAGEVPSEELWYLTEGNCFQNQVNAVCSIPPFDSVKGNFRYISNSIESLKRIVETQGGITFIPELATLSVSTEYEDLIKRFKKPEPYRELSLVYLKNTGMKKLVRAFIELIQETVPSRMLEKPVNDPLDAKM